VSRTGDDADSATARGARRHAPATLRNRDPILALLREELPERGAVLEVASGSGEHALWFARALPGLSWQPSDPDAEARASIAAWAAEASLPNLRSPLALDACDEDWPVDRADAVVCCNMVHISPWRAAEGLFAGAGRLLAEGGPLFLYGPFLEDDVPTAPSNVAFDLSLRSRDPDWGLRRVSALDELAERAGLVRTRRESMPANNLVLVWRRRGADARTRGPARDGRVRASC
jgi:SAM-dependent methyltransferase